MTSVYDRRAAAAGLVDLASGVPRRAPTPAVLLDAVRNDLAVDDRWLREFASPGGSGSLRAAILAVYDGLLRAADHAALVTHGAVEALSVACARSDRNSSIAVPAPGFPLYTTVVGQAERSAVPYRLVRGADGWHLDLAGFARAASACAAVVLNVPHNPTGWAPDASELPAIVDIVAATGVRVIVDDVYGHLDYTGDRLRLLAALVAAGADVMVVGSIAKRFDIAGVRLGWLVVPAALEPGCAATLEGRSGFVSGIDQQIGEHAFAMLDVDALAADYGRAVTGFCATVGLPPPTGGYFVFVEPGGAFDEWILSTPGSWFGDDQAGNRRLCLSRPDATLERAAEAWCAGRL